MQLFEEWLAFSSSVLQSLLGGKTVDLPLEVEQGIDTLNGLQRYGRDRRGFASTFGVRGEVGQHKELAARVRPAECLRQRRGIAICFVERVIAAIGISLQNTGEGSQVALGMLLSPVSRCVEQCRRR